MAVQGIDGFGLVGLEVRGLGGRGSTGRAVEMAGEAGVVVVAAVSGSGAITALASVATSGVNVGAGVLSVSDDMVFKFCTVSLVSPVSLTS